MAGADSDREAEMMLEKVRTDRRLSAPMWSRAWREAGDLSHPTLALSRVQAFAQIALPEVPRTAPTRDMTRVVTAHTFWRHHTRPELRDTFMTSEDFVRYIDSSPDPVEELWRHLARDLTVFPWQRSWMAPTSEVRGLSGRQLAATLELGSSSEPPYVVFHMPLEDLRDNGVLLREPNSLDSVLGPSPQWTPRGLASGVPEYVDGDVPVRAVREMEWVR